MFCPASAPLAPSLHQAYPTRPTHHGAACGLVHSATQPASAPECHLLMQKPEDPPDCSVSGLLPSGGTLTPRRLAACARGQTQQPIIAITQALYYVGLRRSASKANVALPRRVGWSLRCHVPAWLAEPASPSAQVFACYDLSIDTVYANRDSLVWLETKEKGVCCTLTRVDDARSWVARIDVVKRNGKHTCAFLICRAGAMTGCQPAADGTACRPPFALSRAFDSKSRPQHAVNPLRQLKSDIRIFC